jgi:hypothetical protein
MLPFLVQFADKPDSEPELVTRKDVAGEEVSDAGPFHTRCGHPRHRDD